MRRAFGVLMLAATAVSAQLVHDTTTATLEFASGGTVKIVGSHGDLNIEGWDRPEVELTVTRSAHDPKKKLDEIGVKAARTSPSEISITTSFPRRTLRRLNRGKSGLLLEYRIRVPRESHLMIQQDLGMVMVIGVTGKVEARNCIGDIVVLAPPAKEPSDLHVKLGSVSVEETSLTPRAPQ